MSIDLSSRVRLTEHSLKLFPEQNFFGRIARAVCRAGCLPRKELFEAWEVARRLHRRVRGRRVVDLAAGHGLLAWLMLLLDRDAPGAICVDRREPPSAAKLARVMVASWPHLEGRVSYLKQRLERAPVEAEDLVVSVHACGPLTDQVLDLAITHRSAVGVLPCCHSLRRCDRGSLDGWLDGALAIDVTRAARLRAAGYRVITQKIPEEITPLNRLLIGLPG